MINCIQIDRIRMFVVSAETSSGPESSMGKIGTRKGLLIEITDTDGGTGWGEIWCNFPPRAAETLAILFEDLIAPQVFATAFNDWRAVRPHLEASLSRMILHTAQPGPFAHCFAGLDIAFADLCARRENLPLSEMLSGAGPTEVGVYASSPSGRDFREDIEGIIAAGHSSVKLKIGYDDALDARKLDSFVAIANGQLALRVDANQAWSLEAAKVAMKRLAKWAPIFVEEPLRADAADTEWIELSQHAELSVAAGENILSGARFADCIDRNLLGVVQPSATKWGGVSGAYAVADRARDAGVGYAFHYMGTALGLAASLHVCAAAGAVGPVELDANENALRTGLGDIDLSVNAGMVRLPTGAGHGFTPDPAALEAYSDGKRDLRGA